MNGGNASRFQHLWEGSELKVSSNESCCQRADRKSALTRTRGSKLLRRYQRCNVAFSQTRRLAMPLKNQAVLRILGVLKGRPDGRVDGEGRSQAEGIWNAPAHRSSVCPRLQTQIISPVIRL